MNNNNDLEREGSSEIVKDVDGAHKFKVSFVFNFSNNNCHCIRKKKLYLLHFIKMEWLLKAILYIYILQKKLK